MNILHITNQLDVGGITSYVLTLSSGLKKKGHNVFVASSGGELLPKFSERGIVFIPIPINTKSEISPKIFMSLFGLIGLVKRNNIDIVHAHSRTTQVLGCLLGKVRGIPYVSTCHGFFKTRFSRRLLPCWGQKVIAISQQVKTHLVDDFKIEDRRIEVIHNGIDIERFQGVSQDKRLRGNFGLGDGPVVGIVARLSDVKGHSYLIEAMKPVLEKIPSAQLVIVGEGRMKEELISLAKKLKIEKNVVFMPTVSDTKEVLSAIDVFVMPSLNEGLGLALMEAMSCGLPVVGSNVGGIKSLIQHGINGLLTEPAEVKGLSSAILDLLTDRKKALALGSNAKDFISRNFSQGQMISETERVYLECVKVSS